MDPAPWLDPGAWFAIALGTSLAAASGFRVLAPPLVLSLAARVADLPLPDGLGWLEHPLAPVLLGAALLVEIAATYVPFVDNALDAVSIPAAAVAGTLVARAFFPDAAPLAEWVAAAALGGGAAAGIGALAAATRLASSATTGGLGNPLLATAENAAAFGLPALALAAPLVALALLVALVAVLARSARRIGRRRSSS